MTLEQMVHGTYAFHFVLCNLGFEPDHIGVGTPPVANEGGGLFACGIARRDGLQFVYTIAPLADHDACVAYLDAYRTFALAQPKMPRAELDRIALHTEVWRRRGELFVALTLKGFELTEMKN